MRINTCDHQRENALIFFQILSTSFLRKCVDISLENLYVDIGDLRVKGKQLMKAAFTSSRDRVFFTWRKHHGLSVCYLKSQTLCSNIPTSGSDC